MPVAAGLRRALISRRRALRSSGEAPSSRARSGSVDRPDCISPPTTSACTTWAASRAASTSSFCSARVGLGRTLPTATGAGARGLRRRGADVSTVAGVSGSGVGCCRAMVFWMEGKFSIMKL
jgi:hypothetical protein